MQMTDDRMRTEAPDSGLRIRTEVKPQGPRPETAAEVEIVCTSVNLAYGDNHVLHDVSMEMDSRRVTALIGPSGCGKSTLLRCFNRMNDLIDNVRIWGEILVGGLDVNAATTDVIEVRRRVGMVFQKSNPFPKSIFENVVYGLRIAGINDKKTLEEACVRSLKGCCAMGRGEGPPGGERPRAVRRADAAALHRARDRGRARDHSHGRALLRARPYRHAKIEELIYQLKERYTIVIVTHNLQQAARVSDRTALFWLGRLVEYAPTAEIFTAPKDKLTEDYITGRFG